MIRRSKLLEEMFNPVRLQKEIDKAEKKGINKGLLRKISNPEELIKIYGLILTGNYHISPPHVIRIPKDKPGEFRECKANEELDRIILSLVNDSLMDLFPEMIHVNSKAYQSGISCPEITQESVKEIAEVKLHHKGYKCDFSKYFDTIQIRWIDWALDIVEQKLGFENGTEPVINMLREFYHSDWLFNLNGDLVEEYTSLKQGSATAAWLSNVIIYDIDQKMTEICDYYVRYSDDSLIIGEQAEEAIKMLKQMIIKYGVSLNDNKVKAIFDDRWITFLGFNIKGNLITLSPNRIKKFQKEILKRTLDKPNITMLNAKKSIMNYLYDGDYNWATSCFSIINCKPDIDEMNKFIMDCLRACEMRDRERAKGKKTYKISHSKIGGLGIVEQEDRTIMRGVGKNVARNRKQTEKEIQGYLSVGCLVKNYQQSKTLFQAVVRGIK